MNCDVSQKKAHLLPADDRVKLRALLGDEDNALNLAMLPWDSLRLRGASEHARSLFTCLAKVSIMWKDVCLRTLDLLINCKTIRGNTSGGRNGIIGRIDLAWRQSFGLKICPEKRGQKICPVFWGQNFEDRFMEDKILRTNCSWSRNYNQD